MDTEHGKARCRRHGRGLGVATPLLPASAKPCRKRAWSEPMLPWQWSIHAPVNRFDTTPCRSRSPSVNASRIESLGSEAAYIHDAVLRVLSNRRVPRTVLAAWVFTPGCECPTLGEMDYPKRYPVRKGIALHHKCVAVTLEAQAMQGVVLGEANQGLCLRGFGPEGYQL
jgi:hypothetical protein